MSESEVTTKAAAKKSSKTVIAVIVSVVIALVLAFAWCWKIRDTPSSIRAERKQVSKTFRAAKSEDVVPYLEKLITEKSFHTCFIKDKFFIGFRTIVPISFVAQLTEEAIIRFAGNGSTKPVDEKHMKDVVAFSDKLLPMCVKQETKNSLRERRLDAFFLIKDYDRAITLLDQGLPGRDAAWCKGTAAKLRAHKAADAKNWKEAIKQLLVFGEFMLSDAQKDFEDCDPTTGIVYSREWVVARNLMRCSEYAKNAGDAASSAKHREDAKKYFKTALEKAQGDETSLKVLQQEMKTHSL